MYGKMLDIRRTEFLIVGCQSNQPSSNVHYILFQLLLMERMSKDLFEPWAWLIRMIDRVVCIHTYSLTASRFLSGNEDKD